MQKSKNGKIRLVVDVNAWISSLLSPRFQVRLEVVFGVKYQLIVSEQLYRELDRTIRNRTGQKRFAVLHNPHKMEFDVKLRVRCATIIVHKLHHNKEIA